MVKEKLIPKNKLIEMKEALLKVAEEKIKKIHYSKVQLDYLATETNPAKLRLNLSHMHKAALWEIATSNEIIECLKDTSLDQNDINSIKVSIASGLGIRSGDLPICRSELNQYYRNEIIKALETTEDRIRHILDDIHKLCEFDSVLGAIHNCSYVNSLPKRDRKIIYEDKQKFEKVKIKTIEGLKFLKLPYHEVENKKFISSEEWVNYETTLKHIKKVLTDDLILICGTGKRRAYEISKIIEYI